MTVAGSGGRSRSRGKSDVGRIRDFIGGTRSRVERHPLRLWQGQQHRRPVPLLIAADQGRPTRKRQLPARLRRASELLMRGICPVIEYGNLHAVCLMHRGDQDATAGASDGIAHQTAQACSVLCGIDLRDEARLDSHPQLDKQVACEIILGGQHGLGLRRDGDHATGLASRITMTNVTANALCIVGSPPVHASTAGVEYEAIPTGNQRVAG
jgi:hypothetical protein